MNPRMRAKNRATSRAEIYLGWSPELWLEPWPDVIQTSARRLLDAGQTRPDVCQTSARRLPD
eukprot:6338013-Prymnesium_polylepis.1